MALPALFAPGLQGGAVELLVEARRLTPSCFNGRSFERNTVYPDSARRQRRSRTSRTTRSAPRVANVELDNDGVTLHLHYAPYLDYRPLKDGEPSVDAILARPECTWIGRDLEQAAQAYAVADVVPEHLAEVRTARLALIEKTEAAVKDRLTKEISYWDHRAAQLELEENAGKTAARLNSGEARRRADTMQTRLQKRLAVLKRDAQISPRPPVVLGGLLVIPRGLLDAMTGRPAPTAPVDTQASAARARHRDGDRA